MVSRHPGIICETAIVEVELDERFGVLRYERDRRDDNRQLVQNLRETHGLCDEHGDVATASLIENWIDEAERRTWFLFEAARSS